jgi:hypothetical protein
MIYTPHLFNPGVSLCALLIYIVSLLGSITFLGSCSEAYEGRKPIEGTSRRIILDPSDAVPASWSEVLESYQLIELESSDSSIFGRLERVIVRDSLFVISDEYGVYFYSFKGRFVSKIRRQGLGPGEYRVISDIGISKAADTVEVMDNQSRKLLQYTREGKLLREYQIPLVANSFVRRGSFLSFYSGNEINPVAPYALNVASDAGDFRILSSFFKINPEHARYLHIMYTFNFAEDGRDGYFFFQPLNDTIYSLRQNLTLQPAVIIDFQRSKINQEKLFSRNYADIMEFFVELKQRKWAFNVANVVSSISFLSFTYHIGDRTIWVVYDKDADSAKQIESVFFPYEGASRLRLTPELVPVSSWGDQLIFALEPYLIKATVDTLRAKSLKGTSDETRQATNEIYGLDSRLKLDDNPVLIVAKLKKGAKQ